MTEYKSKLSEALEARERKLHVFDLESFFGIGEKPLPKLGMWLNSKEEQDLAVKAALRYVAKDTAGIEFARNDPDLTSDAKTIEILYLACRDADNPKYPAFPSPGWMRKHLHTGQLAVLLNLYNEVVKHDGSLLWEIDSDRVEAISSLCAAASATDVPEQVLANLSREYLTQLVVMISCKLDEARKASTAIQSEDVQDRS